MPGSTTDFFLFTKSASLQRRIVIVVRILNLLNQSRRQRLEEKFYVTKGTLLVLDLDSPSPNDEPQRLQVTVVSGPERRRHPIFVRGV